jgi:Tfp pilus assembly protein PilN
MGAVAVLGALVFAIAAMAAYVTTGNTVKDRQAELQRVQDDAQLVQTQLAALKPYADFQTIAAERVSTVTQLAQGRFDWEQALRDLSRALPADARLKSLKGSVSTGVGGGSGLRSARPAPAIELSGCTKTQSDVARLMSRLRVVRGVTRVALSKSERAAPQAGGSGVVVGAAGDPNALCGNGRPPAFELVVFFERSAATAVGQVVPGAPAATPAAQAAQAGSSTSGSGQTGSSSTQPSTTGVSAP